MLEIETLLEVLAKAEVDFIIVGGIAAIAHGSSRLTQDLDVVYRRTPDNIARLASALTPYSPYLRGAPPGLPFRWDAETIRRGLNFTLTTSLGPLDVLGEIAGGGTYEELLPYRTHFRLRNTVSLPWLGPAHPRKTGRRTPQGSRSHRRVGSSQRGTGEEGRWMIFE